MPPGVLQTYPTYRIRWERLKEFLEVTFQDWEHDFEEKRKDDRFHFYCPRELTSEEFAKLDELSTTRSEARGQPTE